MMIATTRTGLWNSRNDSTAIASKRHVPPIATWSTWATFISSMHHYRQIVRSLRTILQRTCILQIFSELHHKVKIVRKLRTISVSTVELYSRVGTLYRYTYSLQNDVRKKNTKNKISLLKVICCPHYRKTAQRQKTIKYKTTYEKR